jgi:tetratricopeptide (TPR) repeat protein
VALSLLLADSHGAQSKDTSLAAGGQKQALPSYLNAEPGVEYVGDRACKGCHSTEYNRFKQTGMGQSTAVPSPEDLRVLTRPVTISGKPLHRTYTVYSRDGKMYHEESERDANGQLVFSETHEINYTVGSGEVGKSYLVAKGDALFVSPISYYTRINAWDLSPGYEAGVFRGFTRPVVELCADCHTGQPSFVSGKPNRFQQPPFRSLTIGCERCHGPGAIHVQQRKEGASLGGPVDFSIVNPAKLPMELRDDVCAQCHFAGDARVLRPGKNYLDFRPGTKLANVVAIFSASPALKGTRFIALDQFEQLKMSRCAIASKGRLGCITCHDPHVQLHGVEAAEQFRERCLTCHKTDTCLAPLARRRATSPPDNCVQCHMPKEPLENISHASSADHRILRDPSENPLAGTLRSSIYSAELIYAATPLNFSEARPDLRSLALAYTQAVPRYPELGQKGFAVLELAARELPDDAEVQASYGLILLIAQPRESAHAAEILQKAIALGSKSPEVRTKLGNLRLRQGQVTAAIDLYKDSIQVDSFYTPPYLELARVYSLLKDFKSAREILDLVLKGDPGNDAAREERQKLGSSSDGSL